jgi:hypothetical protein
LINPAGYVQGMPFAPALKGGALRLFPELKSLPLHQRLDRRRVRYWPLEQASASDWLPVGWLIKLQRRENASATLLPREPAAAIADIMKEAWSKTRRTSISNFKTLARTVASAQCYQLVYSDLNDAAELLKRLCHDG